MKRLFAIFVVGILLASPYTPLKAEESIDSTSCAINPSLDFVLEDIYTQMIEDGEDYSEETYEAFVSELTELATHPINLNTATENDLLRLRFLSAEQADAILRYVYKRPMVSLYELNLIPELHSYDIRNLLPFVYAAPVAESNRLYANEVFRYAKHDILLRTDARNVEHFTGDPMYVKGRYTFNYQNRVQFGATLVRPAGGNAKDLEYGFSLQLNKLGPMREIVAGNYQAHFGLGLVMSNPFHIGKNNYILTCGLQSEGLRKYSSTNGKGLHGVGATVDLSPYLSAKSSSLSLSAFYSGTRPNDSLVRHIVGGNVSFRYRQMRFGLTFTENIWSDSVVYYHNPRYTQHYFHGSRQAVLGLNFRYHAGILDLLGEVATAQNTRWGVGLNFATRITPVQDIGLMLLYRYYSPSFDNTLGYGFSETSRINDENGVYLGLDIKRLKNWRFAAYGDVFYFDGIKYGIPYRPSWGYDAMLETDWLASEQWNMRLKIRAREKAEKPTYSLRYQFTYEDSGWHLRTQADANGVVDSLRHVSYGVSVFQDIAYTFSAAPVTLQFRLQGFYAPEWDNRFYIYENDVLYAGSSPALYGIGGRAYVNIRCRIKDFLSLYFRISETLYARTWAQIHDKSLTDTDLHLLLRFAL